MSDVLERQRAAPQYSQRVAAVRASLGARHVSPEIIDRVIRLNPRLEEGQRLRGIHYSRTDDPRFNRDCASKGSVIRKHGRVTWDGIQRTGIFKRGRREYATREAFVTAIAP